MASVSRPWAELPPEVGDVLRSELRALAAEVVEAVSREVPEYAQPVEGAFGRGLRLGVARALRRFVELIGSDTDPRAGGLDVYVGLGRGEYRAGRSLDALQRAYRVGARVAWRRLAQAGRLGGLTPDTLITLAEAIFAYIDELSAASVEGYAFEQSASLAERQRRRRRLATLLVGDPEPADPALIEAAARDAGWPLPRSVAVVATLLDRIERVDRVATAVDPAVLAAAVGDLAVLVVPDPEAPRRPEAVRAALGDRTAALGPAVGWADGPSSFARAAAAVRLAIEGALPPGLVVAEDHLATLIIASDARLAGDLAERRLAPLDAGTTGAADRHRTTLRAWLDAQGRVDATAAALHVHPQTVRYRVARLRALLGAALDDPQGRFELALALRARDLGRVSGGRPHA